MHRNTSNPITALLADAVPRPSSCPTLLPNSVAAHACIIVALCLILVIDIDLLGLDVASETDDRDSVVEKATVVVEH